MLRIVASRAMRVGRATVFLMGLALMLALVFGMVSTAFGANGGNFILGSVNNAATAITRLTGNVDGGPALRVSNPSTDPGSTALDLQVETGKAPMKVNSGTKVTDLNADRVDGKDSTALGITMKSAHGRTGDTSAGGCTSPGVFSACAPVTIKVPADKQYHVTVLSSFTAMSAEATEVTYCPAIKGGSFGLSCIDTGKDANAISDFISLAPFYGESAATSGQIGPLPAGTYTFSTTIKSRLQLESGNDLKAHTTVMVRDASAPGPPIQ
jgi:hypothetical protein